MKFGTNKENGMYIIYLYQGIINLFIVQKPAKEYQYWFLLAKQTGKGMMIRHFFC